MPRQILARSQRHQRIITELSYRDVASQAEHASNLSGSVAMIDMNTLDLLHRRPTNRAGIALCLYEPVELFERDAITSLNRSRPMIVRVGLEPLPLVLAISHEVLLGMLFAVFLRCRLDLLFVALVIPAFRFAVAFRVLFPSTLGRFSVSRENLFSVTSAIPLLRCASFLGVRH